MNLFGRNKPGKPQTTPREALERLDLALSDLDKRERAVEKRIEGELAAARKLVADKNRSGAKHALKRKRMYEDALCKLHGTRLTVEAQKMALENAHFNLDIMHALRQGALALGTVNKNLGIDDVDKMMDDIREQTEMANDISEAISQPTSFGFEDEEEIEAELAELEAEGLDDSLLRVEAPPMPLARHGPALGMPSAPQEDEEEEEEVDEELRRLEASMA